MSPDPDWRARSGRSRRSLHDRALAPLVARPVHGNAILPDAGRARFESGCNGWDGTKLARAAPTTQNRERHLSCVGRSTDLIRKPPRGRSEVCNDLLILSDRPIWNLISLEISHAECERWETR